MASSLRRDYKLYLLIPSVGPERIDFGSISIKQLIHSSDMIRDSCLHCRSDPQRRKRARLPPQLSAAVIAFWGDRDRDGQGEPKQRH